LVTVTALYSEEMHPVYKMPVIISIIIKKSLHFITFSYYSETNIVNSTGFATAVARDAGYAARVVLEDIAQGVDWIYKFPLGHQLSAQVIGCGEIIPGLFKILVDNLLFNHLLNMI
jgi:hypothetical protein